MKSAGAIAMAIGLIRNACANVANLLLARAAVVARNWRPRRWASPLVDSAIAH
jgi:hypothetical protein